MLRLKVKVTEGMLFSPKTFLWRCRFPNILGFQTLWGSWQVYRHGWLYWYRAIVLAVNIIRFAFFVGFGKPLRGCERS